MTKFSLIPEPQIIIELDGQGTKITTPFSNGSSGSSLEISKDLMESLSNSMKGKNNKVKEKYGFEINCITADEFCSKHRYSYGDKFDREEGYILYISNGAITIGSFTEKGYFYAIQTLAQIIATADNEYIPELLIIDWPNVRIRGFNLCYHMVSETMPMFAPNYETTIQLIEEYAHFKMNTLLIEFEGMFPYIKYPQLNNKIAFTLEQITSIYNTCKKNHITIIPLVQCLGHAYSVLRHPEFAHLRELPNTTQQYCPCNPDARTLYFELIDEIIKAFPEIKYLHIGGDEAKRLGKCPKCKKKLETEGMGSLYGDHVNEIGKYILSRNIKPIVWGDIMEAYPDILDKLEKDMVILYWNYDLVDWPRPYNIEMFTESNKEIIVGSAAKFGSYSDYMFQYKKSMRNISIMASEALRTGVPGIIVTDWMKLAPTEVAIIANVYGAQTS